MRRRWHYCGYVHCVVQARSLSSVVTVAKPSVSRPTSSLTVVSTRDSDRSRARYVPGRSSARLIFVVTPTPSIGIETFTPPTRSTKTAQTVADTFWTFASCLQATSLRVWSVCLSVRLSLTLCTPTKLFNGMRCHLTHYQGQSIGLVVPPKITPDLSTMIIFIHQICRDTDVTATEALQLAEDRPFWRTIATAGGSFGWSLRVTTTTTTILLLLLQDNTVRDRSRVAGPQREWAVASETFVKSCIVTCGQTDISNPLRCRHCKMNLAVVVCSYVCMSVVMSSSNKETALCVLYAADWTSPSLCQMSKFCKPDFARQFLDSFLKPKYAQE